MTVTQIHKLYLLNICSPLVVAFIVLSLLCTKSSYLTASAPLQGPTWRACSYCCKLLLEIYDSKLLIIIFKLGNRVSLHTSRAYGILSSLFINRKSCLYEDNKNPFMINFQLILFYSMLMGVWLLSAPWDWCV